MSLASVLVATTARVHGTDRCTSAAGNRLGALATGAFLILAILGSPVLLTPLHAQEIECPNAQDVAVRVTALHGEVSRNSSLGLEEIRRLAGPETAARHQPLLGMIGAAVAVRIVTDVSISDGGDRRSCAVPKAINVDVGFADRVAFVAREAAANACLHQAVLSHELRHARLDNQALDVFVPALSQRLREVAQSMRPARASNPDEARSNVQERVEAAVDTLMDVFKANRRALHRALDSRNELDRIRTACDGHGIELNDQMPSGSTQPLRFGEDI